MAKFLKSKRFRRILLLVALSVVAVLAVLGNWKVQESQIVYDGQTLTWNSVPFSRYYELKFNQAAAVQTEEPRYEYPQGGDFDLTLTVHKTLFPDSTVEKQFRFLRAADGLRYENGVLHWNPVENAASYAVEVNGVILGEVTEPKFAYANEGDAIFRVKALGPNDSYYSYYSEVYSVRILGMVQNLRYDYDRNLISWDPVLDAAYYTVKINGSTFLSYTNQYTFDAAGGDFTLSVQANSASSNRVYDSKFTPEQHYTNLPTVTDLRVENGAVCWTPSAGADAYRVWVNGQEMTLTEPALRDLTPGVTYRVKVQPISTREYTYAYVSAELTFSILQTPTLTVREYGAFGVTFDWAATDARTKDAVGQIYKDGTLLLDGIALPAADKTYTYDFPESGTYTFRVRAADTETESQSAWSPEVTVVRMADLTSHTIHDDLTALNSRSYVSFDAVANAKDYRLLLDGTVVKSSFSEPAFDLTDLAGTCGKTVTLTVCANSYQADGVWYLEGQTPHSFEITRMGVPPLYPILSEYRITWTGVTGATKYLLIVSHQGEETHRVVVEGTAYEIASLTKEAGDYTFDIRTLGENGALSSDNGTRGKSLARLFTPDGVRISEENGKKLLRWNPVAHASAYQVKIGNKTYPVTASQNPVFDLTALVTSQVQGVTVTAIGGNSDGKWLVLDGKPTAALEICRLAAPTQVKVTNEAIEWSPVENASMYDVFIDGVFTAQVTGGATRLSHENLMQDGGKTYTVQVRAHGDGETQFDGELSGKVTVTRLAKPSFVRMQSGSDSLSWSKAPTGTTKVILTFQYTPIELERTATSYRPSLTAVGDYLFSVRFEGSGDATLTKSGTISSPEVGGSFTVQKLPTPVLRLYGKTIVVEGPDFYTDNRNDANQYVKWVFVQNGQEKSSSLSSVNGVSGDRYEVYAKGGFFCPNFADNGYSTVYYLDSDRSATITVP